MLNGRTSERIKEIKFSKIREVLAKVEGAREKGIEITNFSIGRPDFDTPKHIKEVTKKALDDGLVQRFLINIAMQLSLRAKRSNLYKLLKLLRDCFVVSLLAMTFNGIIILDTIY